MEKDKQKDLDKLFKEAAEGYQSTYKKETGVSTFWKVVIGAVSVLAIVIVVLLGMKLFSNNNEFIDKTQEPDWGDVGSNNTGGGSKAIKYPVEVPEWTKKTYDKDTFFEQKDIYEEVLDWTRGAQQLYSAVGWIPTGRPDDEGNPSKFTKDLSAKSNEEEGIFAYILQEDYIYAYSVGIQRLINPHFGDWVAAQNPNSAEIGNQSVIFNALQDMFSDEYWDSVKDDFSKLPILVDWDADGFGTGKRLLTDGTPGSFYGEVIIDEENPVRVTERGKGLYEYDILEIITPVKYKAFQGKEVIEKQGEITLVLSPNDYEFDESKRIVITHAKLILE